MHAFSVCSSAWHTQQRNKNQPKHISFVRIVCILTIDVQDNSMQVKKSEKFNSFPSLSAAVQEYRYKKYVFPFSLLYKTCIFGKMPRWKSSGWAGGKTLGVTSFHRGDPDAAIPTPDM
jgi:hypothetical protein